MRIKNFLPTLAACALLALMTVSAAAQVGRLEGDVKKKGSGEPVAGAIVDIIRTDIKWSDKVTSDKKGHFLHAGVALAGTYTLLVSAEGCAPTYLQGVKIGGEPIKFELDAGDGHRLTLDELKKALGATGAAPGAGAAKAPPQLSEAEIKKQREDYEKKKAEVEKHNANIGEVNKLLAAGNQLLNNKDYAGAVNSYNEAIKMAPDEYVLYNNLAVALQNLGVTQYNAKQRDEAKKSWIDSAEAAGKAVSLLDAQVGSDPAKANDPKNKAAKVSYLKVKSDSEVFLAAQIGDPAQAEAAAKDLQTLTELSTDPAEKKAYRVKLAKTYFQIGKMPETVAIYQEILQSEPDNLDALFGLGLCYSIDEAKAKDAAELWKKFLSKAPAKDERVAMVQEGLKTLSVSLAAPKATPTPKVKK